MDSDALQLIAFLVLAAIGLLRRLLGSEKKARPASPFAGTAGRLTLYLQRLAGIRARAEQVLARLGDLDPEIGDRLGPVLGDELIPRTGELARRLAAQIEAAAATATATATTTAPGVEAVDLVTIGQEIETLGALVEVVQTMVEQRLDPETRPVLADADALAEACYRPIIEFADHHDVRMASSHPMTVFRPGGTAIHLAFLPYRLAPIALPPAYRTEPWRWPAIAHEIAHDLVASVPGLRDEMVEQLGLDRDADGEETGSDRLMHQLFRVWMDEIFADAIGALMIGPAYLRSMVSIFAQPEYTIEVLAIVVPPEGFVDPHPPRHLRVHMTERFLHRMGHGSRASELRQQWDTLHEQPAALALVTPVERRPLPAAPIIELGGELMDRLYFAEFQLLAGHRLADIPGLEFASTHERRAAAARERLARGQPAAFDARSLIAGATEAALDAPERTPVIQRAVQESIVGVGSGERPAQVRARALAVPPRRVTEAPAPAPRRDAVAPVAPRAAAARQRPHARITRLPVLPLDAARVRDALLLGEIFEPAGTRRGRRGPAPVRRPRP